MPNHFDPFATPAIEDPSNDQWAAKRKISSATRRLINNLLTSTSSPKELKSIANEIEKLADSLEKKKNFVVLHLICSQKILIMGLELILLMN